MKKTTNCKECGEELQKGYRFALCADCTEAKQLDAVARQNVRRSRSVPSYPEMREHLEILRAAKRLVMVVIR